MNTPLKLFTDPAILARVQRPILTRFLEDRQVHLPPDAAALLQTSLNGLTFEEYCAAWATQFASINQFGAPLLEALHAIEFLALPENASILNDALSHLPPGYEINRNFSTLHQAMHLWMLAHSPAGISWPSERGALERRERVPEQPFGEKSSTSDASAPTAHDGGDADSLSASGGEGKGEEPFPSCGQPLSTLSPQVSTPNDAPRSDVPDAPADLAAASVPIRRLAPWPDPIPDPTALFDQIHDRALHYLYLPPGAAVVLTVWAAHSHAVKAFTHSPRLYVTSTESGCGKTTALDFIACLCPNVLRTDNIKPPVLYRIIHKHEPTFCLDEFDAYAHQYPDLRGLIDAGHNLHGCAMRCEGPNVRYFKAYAATAIAGIGELAPTLTNRSIIIRLTKAPPDALKARFDRRHTKVETTLGRQIGRWVQDNYAAIAACDPVMPPEVINRLADNWRPLFAVAQVIGGHWPQRLLEAFNTLQALNSQPSRAPGSDANSLSSSGGEGWGDEAPSPRSQPTSLACQLLTDVRQIFTQTGATKLFASDLVRALHALPNRPWAGSHNGSRPLTVTGLARHLSSLGIYSRTLRIGPQTARGYVVSALVLPEPPPAQTPALGFQI